MKYIVRKLNKIEHCIEENLIFDDWEDAYDQFCQFVFEVQTETNEKIIILKDDNVMQAESSEYLFTLVKEKKDESIS